MQKLAVRTTVEAHLGSRAVARIVYGSIIGVALVVTLQSHPPSAATMTGWLVGTGVAVGLAELYSEVVGEETRTRKRVTRRRLGHMTEEALWVTWGVAFPAVFFLFAALGVGSVEGAFTVAKWSGLGLVAFYGFWAARFAGAPLYRAVLYAVLVALVDGALVALKALLH